MKYPLNEIFLSLQLVILRSHLIFCFLGLLFLKLMDVGSRHIAINLKNQNPPITKILFIVDYL
ncbi:hypothetical protein CON61_30145 [Bacillus toyonensis]|nr:hypothetical protein CON61_30145 [Bacillus toyonensis]